MYFRQSRVPPQNPNLILDDRLDTRPSQSCACRETLFDTILWSLQVAVYPNIKYSSR